MSENTGFFSQILKRRLPQFFGVYLAGGWTSLEFTQWAVGRYSLSPNWEEVLVVFFLLCLPLILVLAWHHGAPGKQKWTLFEKIFLPLYLIAIPAVLHHIYAEEDLGRTVEMVMVKDSSGSMQKRQVAKTAYIKPLIIFPLNNVSGDQNLDYLAAISSEVINRDLSQNMFVSSMDLSLYKNDLKSLKQTFKKIPLSLQITLAKQKNREFLINGELNKSLNNYDFVINIYNAKNGHLKDSFKQSHSNYFSAIDQIGQQLTKRLMPNTPEYTDLPIEDLYSNNWAAFELYTQARMIEHFGDAPKEAESYFLQAIELDPSFSMASFAYAIFNTQQNAIVKARDYVIKAQQHQRYRMTEREQFAVNATSYILSQQREKGFQTLDQWIALYPNDWQAYLMKAQFSGFNNNGTEETVKNLLKVMELDPSQHHLWDTIGDLYSNRGEYTKALEAYQKYAELNPNNPVAYKNIGDLLSRQGKFDSAINNYQSALSIQPNNSNVLLNLAKSYASIGQFKTAEQHYLEAIKYAIPARLLGVKRELADFYWQYGKRQAAVKLIQEAFVEFSKIQSESQALSREALWAGRYYLAGHAELAEKVVNKAVAMAQTTKEDILLINSQIGHAMLLNEQGKAKQALSLYANLLALGESYSDSNTPVIQHFQGRSFYANGQYQKAIEAFKAFDLQRPDQVGLMEWTAKSHLALNQFAEAEKIYRKILLLAPGYPSYNLAMAKVFIASEKLLDAKSHLEKAIDAWQNSDSSFAELQEAQALLAKL